MQTSPNNLCFSPPSLPDDDFDAGMNIPSGSLLFPFSYGVFARSNTTEHNSAHSFFCKLRAQVLNLRGIGLGVT